MRTVLCGKMKMQDDIFTQRIIFEIIFDTCRHRKMSPRFQGARQKYRNLWWILSMRNFHQKTELLQLLERPRNTGQHP